MSGDWVMFIACALVMGLVWLVVHLSAARARGVRRQEFGVPADELLMITEGALRAMFFEALRAQHQIMAPRAR